jgi:hypothetical protein
MTDVFETTQIVLNSYNIFLNRSKLRGIKPSEIKKTECNLERNYRRNENINRCTYLTKKALLSVGFFAVCKSTLNAQIQGTGLMLKLKLIKPQTILDSQKLFVYCIQRYSIFDDLN